MGSTSAERAESFGQRMEIGRRHGSYEALADDDGVDVVYVASTQQRHGTDTIRFLRSGRHVLCEKPMALGVAEVEAMIDAARRADRFLMEAMWSRFLPSYVELARLLDQRVIGRPLLLQADFSFAVPDEDATPTIACSIPTGAVARCWISACTRCSSPAWSSENPTRSSPPDS